MNERTNIDFIGIGYPKAGTSYIFKQLSVHPEISLNPIKEIRYLNESWFLPKASFINRLFSKNFHYKEYRARLRSRMRYWSKHPTNIKNDHWHRRFLLGRHSDKWYDSLFDADKISGEITPAYVYMREKQVRDLSLRFPELKIIIILRHPVDRTWSHIKMNLAKHKERNVSDLSQEEIDSRMRTLLALIPKYSEAVPLWKKYFKNVFVGFHDDIIERPAGLMKDLLEFLEVKELNLSQLDVEQKINVGVKGDIPDQLKQQLQSHFNEELEILRASSDWPYIDNW